MVQTKRFHQEAEVQAWHKALGQAGKVFAIPWVVLANFFVPGKNDCCYHRPGGKIGLAALWP